MVRQRRLIGVPLSRIKEISWETQPGTHIIANVTEKIKPQNFIEKVVPTSGSLSTSTVPPSDSI